MVCFVPSVCLSIRKSCQRRDYSELGTVRNWVDHSNFVDRAYNFLDTSLLWNSFFDKIDLVKKNILVWMKVNTCTCTTFLFLFYNFYFISLFLFYYFFPNSYGKVDLTSEK